MTLVSSLLTPDSGENVQLIESSLHTIASALGTVRIDVGAAGLFTSKVSLRKTDANVVTASS